MIELEYLYNFISKEVCDNDNCYCKKSEYENLLNLMKKERYKLKNNDEKHLKELIKLFQKSENKCKYMYVTMRSENFIEKLNINENEVEYYIDLYSGNNRKFKLDDLDIIYILFEKKYVLDYVFKKLLHYRDDELVKLLQNGTIEKIMFSMLYFFGYTYINNLIPKGFVFGHVNLNMITKDEFLKSEHKLLKKKVSFKDIYKTFSKKDKKEMFKIPNFYVIAKKLDIQYQKMYVEYILKTNKECFRREKYLYIINYICENRIVLKYKEILKFLETNFYYFMNNKKQFLSRTRTSEKKNCNRFIENIFSGE